MKDLAIDIFQLVELLILKGFFGAVVFLQYLFSVTILIYIYLREHIHEEVNKS